MAAVTVAVDNEASDYSTSVVVRLGATTVAGTVAETSDGVLTWTPSSALAAGSYDVTVFHVKSDLAGDSVSMQAAYVFAFTVT